MHGGTRTGLVRREGCERDRVKPGRIEPALPDRAGGIHMDPGKTAFGRRHIGGARDDRAGPSGSVRPE